MTAPARSAGIRFPAAGSAPPPRAPAAPRATDGPAMCAANPPVMLGERGTAGPPGGEAA